MLLLCGGLVNGPYALITTAVSADLVRTESSWEPSGCRFKRVLTIYMLHQQGTHESLRGNSRALSTVTAIIDGTGSIGVYGTLICFAFITHKRTIQLKKHWYAKLQLYQKWSICSLYIQQKRVLFVMTREKENRPLSFIFVLSSN